MTTFAWQDLSLTPEEEEAWKIMEKEAERSGLIQAEKVEERKTIWIGEFEFFDNYISDHAYQFCLIHRIHEVKNTTEAERNKIALEESLDWIIPDEYKGQIAFSQGFMRNLGGNIRRFEGV
jgi:hypothetical protein